MTAAPAPPAPPAPPQVIRDRLLRATDGHSNICNMVVVLEAISFLEKYPITKEALEETRLGKLINDIRKKTKNEDLTRRAKKLLRNWQKLIEPGKGEVKEHTGASWASNGAAHPGITATTAPAGKTGQELKNRTDFNNCFSPREDKPRNGKRKGEQKDGLFRNSLRDSRQPINGIDSGSDLGLDSYSALPLEKETPQSLYNEKLNSVPVIAVKPHSSAPGLSSAHSPSSLKASALHKQVRREQTTTGGQCAPRSPRTSKHPRQEAVGKQSTQAQRGATLPNPAPRTKSGDSLGPGPTPPLVSVSIQGLCADVRLSPHASHHDPSLPDGAALVDDRPSNYKRKRKSRKTKSKKSRGKSDGQTLDEGTKPVRLKDRRLSFDPVTCQITPSFPSQEEKEEEEVRPGRRPQPQEPTRQTPPLPPGPFQQTDWKELSRSDIIQSYLSQQSSMLTSSGSHAPGAHSFMTDFLKKEEQASSDAKKKKKTLALAPERPPRGLPGVNREIDEGDLSRLHAQQWSGVNGCYDTNGTWYGWTDCISLDPHGDESRLHILPYVSLE